MDFFWVKDGLMLRFITNFCFAFDIDSKRKERRET